MSMTRKHFVAIADTLAQNRPVPKQAPLFPAHAEAVYAEQHAIWVALRDDLLLTLAAFNPNFNHAQFIAATERTDV
jgi:hypothetical protein